MKAGCMHAASNMLAGLVTHAWAWPAPGEQHACPASNMLAGLVTHAWACARSLSLSSVNGRHERCWVQ